MKYTYNVGQCFLIHVLFPFCVLVKYKQRLFILRTRVRSMNNLWYKYSHVPVNFHNLGINFVSVLLPNTKFGCFNLISFTVW